MGVTRPSRVVLDDRRAREPGTSFASVGRMKHAVAIACLLVGLSAGSGCERGGAGDGGADAGSATLSVRLSAQQIQWKDGISATPTVTAILVGPDGAETDVTAQTTFRVTPAELASVTSATLVVTGDAAGPGMVLATYDGLAADTTFEVLVERTVPGTADPQVPGLFDAATADASQALTIAYPPAGAVVPPNLGEMDVHWRDPAGKDAYEVTLSGGFVTLKTYVASLGAATWTTLAADHWKLLSSGARGVELTVRVRGLATANPATYIEGAEVLRIAAEEVRGGVYYWNTTQAAVMRFDMSAAAAPPERFYPPVGQTGCVGCHAVSRDGTVVAYRRDGDNLNFGNAVRVEDLSQLLTESTQRWNFASIHPNNTDLFTTAQDGLHLTDLVTGVRTPLYTATRIAQPDVSASGTKIVATQVLGGSEVWTSSSRLVVFDYDPTAKTVGAPQPLVEPTGATFPYYASFSPDNEWVIFNQAAGGTSYDNPNAELWVTKADGSMPPIRLGLAETGSHNSWPKWTPFASHEPTANGTEPVIWFTVASRRPFGVRSGANQTPQLWLAPFFPDRAIAGEPATAPAVRLPFQVLSEGNHIAQWTEEIVTIE